MNKYGSPPPPPNSDSLFSLVFYCRVIIKIIHFLILKMKWGNDMLVYEMFLYRSESKTKDNPYRNMSKINNKNVILQYIKIHFPF